MSKRRASLRLWLTGVFVLVGVWLPGFNQGFPRVDVGLYAGLSRWAYSGGVSRWWFLTGPNEDYFNKPPLAFWIHGGFSYLVETLGGPDAGERMWVLRLPALVAAIVCVIATVGVVRTLSGHRVALLAGLVLATTLEFFRYTKALSLDLWLAAFFMLGLWAIARRRTTARWAICGLCFSLALMVKPLLALLPFGLLVVWAVRTDGVRAATKALAGLVVMLAVALPWHVSMALHYGDVWTTAYFGGQALDRIASDTHGSEPVWYYAERLLSLHWPWLVFVVLGVIAAARGRFPRDRASLWLIGIWVIGWYAALTLSTDKSTRYAVAIMPMLAWLASLWMVKASPRWFSRGGGRRIVGWLGPAAVACGAAVWISGLRVHKPIPEEWIALEQAVQNDPSLIENLTIVPHRTDVEGTIAWLYGVWLEHAAAEDAPAGPLLLISPDEETLQQLSDAGRDVAWREGRFVLIE